MSTKCKSCVDKICVCKTNGAIMSTMQTEEHMYYQWSVLNFEAFAQGMVKHAEKTNTLLKSRKKQ